MKVDERQREMQGTSQDEMIEAEVQDAAATGNEIQPPHSSSMICQRQEKIKEKLKMANMKF